MLLCETESKIKCATGKRQKKNSDLWNSPVWVKTLRTLRSFTLLAPLSSRKYRKIWNLWLLSALTNTCSTLGEGRGTMFDAARTFRRCLTVKITANELWIACRAHAAVTSCRELHEAWRLCLLLSTANTLEVHDFNTAVIMCFISESSFC